MFLQTKRASPLKWVDGRSLPGNVEGESPPRRVGATHHDMHKHTSGILGNRTQTRSFVFPAVPNTLLIPQRKAFPSTIYCSASCLRCGEAGTFVRPRMAEPWMALGPCATVIRWGPNEFQVGIHCLQWVYCSLPIGGTPPLRPGLPDSSTILHTTYAPLEAKNSAL